MKVSRISIGRVYNLGNYEHVRYELTVDVPPEASAASAVIALERIIAGLKPERGIKTKDELRRDANLIERMQLMSDEEFQSHYGHAIGTRSEIIGRYQKQLTEELDKAAATKRRSILARQLFDDLGGDSAWKDAKLDWDEEY